MLGRPSAEAARSDRTQVGIVGAGPAGLVLGRLLAVAGIETVVLEARSRDYVERRVRAGVLEQGTVDLLEEIGVGDRMRREGLVHEGLELRFDGRGHRIALSELTGGRAITIYGQQEVVKDLIAARLEPGDPLLFEVSEVELDGLDSGEPTISFRHDGEHRVLRCDAIAGCDGFHGVCRDAAPKDAFHLHQRDYPYAWLGILAEVAPSTDELIYAYHDRGFALHSLRSPELSRLYIQCDPGDDAGDWSDDQIWDELHARFEREGWSLEEGPIVERGVAPMRSFICEPMQHGRLYLAGDAVHIVPPTGAKGLNLAVADVRVLAEALVTWFERGDDGPLEAYSEACLRRVWRTEYFSWWMTTMLHRDPEDHDGFRARMQRAQLEYVCSSPAAGAMLAESYVGLELER